MAQTGDFKDFCEELRIKSSKIHETSDHLVRLKLAVVLTDTKLYAKVLGDFYCIFKAIEEAVEANKDNECISSLWTEKLSRTKAFEEDLGFYTGLGWREFVRPSDAALKYVSRIQEISRKNPMLLVAYVHTMYLAIFSGGFIIRRIVKNTLGLSAEDGLSIFNLPPNTSRLDMTHHIKDAVNKLPIERDVKDEIVQEKIDIFKRNNEIVKAIKPKVSSYKRIVKFIAFLFLFIFVFIYLLWRYIF